MILGFVFKGRVTHWFVPSRLSALAIIAFSLPLVFDGITTYLGLRDTTNDFRVFTGLLCGGAVGTVLIFALSLPGKAQSSSDRDSQRSNGTGAWVLPVLLGSLCAFALIELALVVDQPIFYLPLAII